MTAKILPVTDDRLQQEAIRVLAPLYKEIGDYFMGDGWQSTSNRPILNILAASDGFINVRRAVMDEQGQVLFDDLAWFAKKLCSVISSVSACNHVWSIEGWIHNKRRNILSQPNIERSVRAHGNLVLRTAILLSNVVLNTFLDHQSEI